MLLSVALAGERNVTYRAGENHVGIGATLDLLFLLLVLRTAEVLSSMLGGRQLKIANITMSTASSKNVLLLFIC